MWAYSGTHVEGSEHSERHAAAQVLGDKGPLAPLRHDTADGETPVGVEGLRHSVVPLPVRQWRDDRGQMGGQIGPGTCLAQMPPDLTRWHHKRGDQHSCPMTDVLLLTVCWFTGFNGLGGVWALKHLPPRLFIAADAQAALRTETSGIGVEGTTGRRFGLKVRGVAVEPRDTAMRCEVRLLHKAPETRTDSWARGAAAPGQPPGRQDSSVGLGRGRWQVYELPSTSHPDVGRGETHLGRPGRGAS